MYVKKYLCCLITVQTGLYLDTDIPGMFFWQFPLPLHVKHEISSIYILYNKKQPEKRNVEL